MTDAAATPLVIITVPEAGACVGDSCVVPAQRSQVEVTRQVDADLV
jgi:hypothetical protein